jgi:FixJ family two-component response regulator
MNEKTPRVFVVDDDASMRDSLRDLLIERSVIVCETETFMVDEDWLTREHILIR